MKFHLQLKFPLRQRILLMPYESGGESFVVFLVVPCLVVPRLVVPRFVCIPSDGTPFCGTPLALLRYLII